MRRFLFLGLITCSIPVAGCTSKSATSQLQPSAGAAWGKSSAAAPFNDPRYQNLVRDVEQKPPAAWSGEPESTTHKIGSAVKKASSSVASALTLKPRVDEAPDAVSLSSMPDKINVDVYYQAARLADSSGNAEMAIKQYNCALREDANHIPSLLSLARLYDRRDNFIEAERLYRRAIKVNPDSAMAYNDLGLCLARHDDAEESLAALRQAVKLEPKRKLYRNNLATVLVDMGHNDKAWDELSSVHPTAVAHYNLGYLLYQKGNKAEAGREFTLAYEADKSLTMAQDMLAQLGGETKPPASPSEKVQLGLNAMAAAASRVPQSTSTRATPVALVLSPSELRRIPPTDTNGQDSPGTPPAVRLYEPVPIDTGGQAAPSAAPGTATPQSSGMLVPVPTNSGSIVKGDDESDLPTPQLLQEVAQHVN